MNKQIVFMCVIADRKQKDEIISELADNGTMAIDYLFGMGSFEKQKLMNVLGFVSEKEKIVINGINTKEKSDLIIEILNKKFNFEKHNSGIAFTIPIEKVAY